ncbi:MAG: hypothetical protein ACRCXB_34170 [Aeromonadaceae bacterium]
MNNQFIYIPQSICESHTAAQAIILSDIGYWASSFGSCTNRVTAKEGQRSLANLAGISDRQASNIISELVANGDITAERSRYKADGVSRFGFYKFRLTNKAKPLWLNANGSRKALGNDFVKVSVNAIQVIGVNAAVALAKVMHLFLNRAASKGRKGLNIKSLNLAASIIGLPLSTLRRYLANELAGLVRWNASECVLSLAGGADAVKQHAGADVVTSHTHKSISGVLSRFSEFADWIDIGSMGWERFEDWASSIIWKLRADGVPTCEVETEFESMRKIYA